MEIKVKCICNSVFSFEEEIENNRIKAPVKCLACGSDCTVKANNYIVYKLSQSNASNEKAPVWKKFFGMRPEPTEYEKLDAGDESKTTWTVGDAESGDETSAGRLGLVIGGALLVGVVGAVGWAWLALATGYQFGIVAWALGGLTGGVSYLLAPRGHRWLGMAAAAAAFIAIGGGQFLVAHLMIQTAIKKQIPIACQAALAYATTASAPKAETDRRSDVGQSKLAFAVAGEDAGNTIETWQTFQAKDMTHFLGGAPGSTKPLTSWDREALIYPEGVTDREMENFDQKVLPELIAFAHGKPSIDEYKSALAKKIHDRITFKMELIESINPYSLLWIVLGIATAYRLARNAALQY